MRNEGQDCQYENQQRTVNEVADAGKIGVTDQQISDRGYKPWNKQREYLAAKKA